MSLKKKSGRSEENYVFSCIWLRIYVVTMRALSFRGRTFIRRGAGFSFIFVRIDTRRFMYICKPCN